MLIFYHTLNGLSFFLRFNGMLKNLQMKYFKVIFSKYVVKNC